MLGFKVAHEKGEIGSRKNNEVVLVSGCGDSITVVGLNDDKPAFTATAFNVDNIEKAIKELEAQEFTVVSSRIQKTDSSLGVMFNYSVITKNSDNHQYDFQSFLIQI